MPAARRVFERRGCKAVGLPSLCAAGGRFGFWWRRRFPWGGRGRGRVGGPFERRGGLQLPRRRRSTTRRSVVRARAFVRSFSQTAPIAPLLDREQLEVVNDIARRGSTPSWSPAVSEV